MLPLLALAACRSEKVEPRDTADPFADCGDAEIPYDGADNDCDPGTPDDDLDADGSALADDCDDANPTVGGEAEEVPYTGVDEDCDDATPDDDLDGDGYTYDTDCDDTSAAIHPGATEVPYDGVDQDCDDATPDDDGDGDGHVAAEDCDDGDASVWQEGGTFVGDVTTADPTLCATWCSVAVDGNVMLTGEDVAAADVLDCVVSISGDLSITGSSAIASFEAFPNLATVGGDVGVDDAAIGDLGGFASLTSVGGSVVVSSNGSLTRVSGFPALGLVAGSESSQHPDRPAHPLQRRPGRCLRAGGARLGRRGRHDQRQRRALHGRRPGARGRDSQHRRGGHGFREPVRGRPGVIRSSRI
jgi:hypothetical protein